MQESRRQGWAQGMDKTCAVIGGFVPMGIVVGNAAYESMLAVVGVCWIARSLVAGTNPLPGLVKDSLVLPWFFVYAAILLSLIVNGPGHKGAAHDIVFIRHLIFLAAILDISRRIPVERYFLMGMAGSVLLAGGNIILAHLIGYDLMGKPAARYAGKLKEAARIAGLFAYLAPMLVAWAMALVFFSNKTRTGLLLAGVAGTFLMVQMGIRTTILAAGAGFSFWVCYLIYKRYAWKALAVIVPIALLAAVLAGVYVMNQPMASMYDRASMYKTSWALFVDNPVLGVGVSAFQDAFRAMVASGRVEPYLAPDGSIWLTAEAMHAHNFALMILACTGLVGMAAFVWLFVNIVIAVYTRTEPHYRYGLAVWPIVFLVIGLTNLHFFGDWYQALFVYLTAFTGVLRRA